jgi:hypothetical protein
VHATRGLPGWFSQQMKQAANPFSRACMPPTRRWLHVLPAHPARLNNALFFLLDITRAGSVGRSVRPSKRSQQALPILLLKLDYSVRYDHVSCPSLRIHGIQGQSKRENNASWISLGTQRRPEMFSTKRKKVDLESGDARFGLNVR